MYKWRLEVNFKNECNFIINMYGDSCVLIKCYLSISNKIIKYFVVFPEKIVQMFSTCFKQYCLNGAIIYFVFFIIFIR